MPEKRKRQPYRVEVTKVKGTGTVKIVVNAFDILHMFKLLAGIGISEDRVVVFDYGWGGK